MTLRRSTQAEILKFGDVDCFGYEKKPTFHDRQERYKREKSCIKDITQTFVQKVENEFDRNKRVKQLCDIVHILSCRKQDLHELERKREYAFQKLKEESGPKWKESKLAYVLSSIQTSLFEIKSTVEELKKSIRCLLRYGTVWADLLFPENRQVDLKYQSNYLCLAYLDEEVVNESKLPKSVYSQFIKQRSPIWANIRSEACVTGSTVYRAIGLESLRAEQGHFDEVFRAKPPMEPTNETKANMRHGIENEINGIATLVSVVMPSFFPQMQFYEEGCYVVEHNERPFCVISPDGSLRTNTKATCAVEVKCPTPGNSFFKGPFYKPPVRYVLQIVLGNGCPRSG